MVAKIRSMFRSPLRWMRKIRIAHVACFLLAMGVGVLAFDYVRLYRDFSQFKGQNQESVTLVQQIKEMKISLAQVDEVLTRLNRFSSKLQMIAQIPQMVMPTTRVAQTVVSPSNIVVDGVEYPNLTEKVDIEDLREKLEGLRSEADRQEERLAELDAFYDREEALLSSIPSLRPLAARITSSFGFRKNPGGYWGIHEGIDFGGNYGAKIMAPADGVVEKVAQSPSFGRYVILDHGYGLKSKFAHASQILVKAGQYIKRGKQIALVGNTGHTRGTHLHYEVSLNGTPVDPMDYLFN